MLVMSINSVQTMGHKVREEGHGERDGKATTENPSVPHLLVIQVLFTFSHACPGGRSHQLCQEGLSMRKHK